MKITRKIYIPANYWPNDEEKARELLSELIAPELRKSLKLIETPERKGKVYQTTVEVRFLNPANQVKTEAL